MNLMCILIKNVGPLVDMAAFEQLWLCESDLASVEPLAGLTTLRALVIQSNAQPLANLTPIEDLTALSTLNLSSCHVNDLDGLVGDGCSNREAYRAHGASLEEYLAAATDPAVADCP